MFRKVFDVNYTQRSIIIKIMNIVHSRLDVLDYVGEL